MKKHFLLATIAIISNAAIAQSPDLRPIWDSYPTQSTPGSTIGLDVRVKNYGTVTASSSSLQYRLEDGQGTLIAILGTDGVSSLSPGSESDENITITLPSVVDPCGEFFFVAVADHLNEVNEGIFENNNSSAVQVQLAPADADLNPSFETCPLTTTSGANISSSLNIFNNGTGPSGGASILKFYWHSSPNISGATLVSTESIPNINANDVENDAYSIPVPSNLQAGTYYLIAEVDADHDICETNESNNISLCTIQIQGPDLKPIWSNVPSNAYAGAIINVDVTVHNLGPVSSSNSCTLKYYWSDDPTWNVSDQELGYDIVSSISAYDTEDESATLTLPQSTNGSHYLIAKVDVLENVLETNEFNNETSTLITIGDPPSVCEYKEQMQNWDWRSENYEFYTVQQGVLNVPSPWTSNNFGDQTQYFIQTPTKDFQPSDGWVLIQKDFGTSTAPISNPYFILYNKYSAILRAFVALSDNEINLGNDKVGVSLAFGDGSQRTALLEHYTDSKGRNPLFEFNNNIDELIISNDFGSAQPYYWQHADFLMNYDPCTCKSNGYLELKTRKIEPSQLTFNHIYNLPLPWINNYGMDAIYGTQCEANSDSKTYDISSYKSLNSGLPKIDVTLVTHPTVSSTLSNSIDAGIISSYIARADLLATSGQENIEESDSYKALGFDINIESDYTLNWTEVISNSVLSIPGSDNLNSPLSNKLNYNNPLGVFSLNKMPKITYASDWNGEVGEYPGCREFRYKFTDELEYSINPFVGFDMGKSEIKASLFLQANLGAEEVCDYNLEEQGFYEVGDFGDGYAKYWMTTPVDIGCITSSHWMLRHTSHQGGAKMWLKIYAKLVSEDGNVGYYTNLYKVNVRLESGEPNNPHFDNHLTYEFDDTDYWGESNHFDCGIFQAPVSAEDVCNSKAYTDLVGRDYLGSDKFDQYDNAPYNVFSDGITIYPNPISSNYLNCEIAFETECELKFSIATPDGRITFLKNIISNPKGTDYQFNLDNFSSGMYYLIIESGNNIYTRKIIKI